MSDVLVLGLGKTGLLAAQYLLQAGERVYGADDWIAPETLPEDLTVHPGFHFVSKEQWSALNHHPFREGIISPGVPAEHPLIRQLEHRGVRLISEIELAGRSLGIPLVGITGSNGKSTTVSLIGQMFRESNIPVFVGGNLGTPLLQACLPEQSYQWGIVEVSSFQLERTMTTRFHIAGILNIFPNHLDRHQTMAGYVRAKSRILRNQDRRDFSLVNVGQSAWSSLFCRVCRGRLLPFTIWGQPAEGFYLKNSTIHEIGTGSPVTISIERWRVPGLHNLENLICAVAAARSAGLDPDSIERAMRQFRGLPHRMERAGESGGVLFINDSKSTSPASVRVAVQSMDGPLILLLGGRAKLTDFSEVSAVLTPEKIKAVILFGESGDLIKGFVPSGMLCHRVDGLEEAMDLARLIAYPGESVLLSPGCTSWDQYRNFEERGDHFRRLIDE